MRRRKKRRRNVISDKKGNTPARSRSIRRARERTIRTKNRVTRKGDRNRGRKLSFLKSNKMKRRR